MSTDPSGGACTLHVAAMPFPSEQGTQAVVRTMLEALSAQGRDAHLLTYGAGAFAFSPTFALHRTATIPGRERFRSGPSVRKVLTDVLLAERVRALVQTLEPSIVVAHHVEAAAACLAASAKPVVFFAHTALEPELPTYARSALTPLLRSVGRRIDRGLCRRAHRVAAISPMLRDQLEASSGAAVEYVPPPWPVAQPITTQERIEARRALGLHAEARVLLYAGNLDAYQGWETTVHALGRLGAGRDDVRLLLATASDPAPALGLAEQLGIADALQVVPLGGEATRRRVHAACDVALVPRRAAGGLPIKLLDAMARGVPAIALSRAAAGLPLGAVTCLVDGDSAESVASAAAVLLDDRTAAQTLGRAGRRYVERHHTAAGFVTALEHLCA